MTQSETSVPQPSVTPKPRNPFFGFNNGTERLNGRLAMLAFMGLIVVELLTGQGVLAWLGIHS